MRAVSSAASGVRHVLGVSVQALLIFAILAAILLAFAPVYKPADFLAGTGSVLAGKGQAATSGASISIPDATFGSSVTASVRGKSGLYVRVSCTQDGATVLVAVERTDANGQATFQMGPSPTWTSGSASCLGQAGHFDNRGRFQIDASTTFNVAA